MYLNRSLTINEITNHLEQIKYITKPLIQSKQLLKAKLIG
jgi:hypothetical protein